MKKLNPPQIIIVSFLCVIVIGTILLGLPTATKNGAGTPFIDSLFTATSATCVTGLIVRDTGGYFSDFGKFVIFLLFQIGGLGIMTFSTLFAILLGRKLTIKQDIVIQRTVGKTGTQSIKTLIKYILFITLGIEFIGALLLAVRWSYVKDWPVGKVITNAVFHAVSAFCNAGFSLFTGSFQAYTKDSFISFVMISLIVLGGIGFIVIMEFGKFFERRKHRILSIQTKLALTISVILIAAGCVIFFTLENANLMAGLSFKDKLVNSLFQSVTARTAGFNTLDTRSFTVPTLTFFIFLMFIGASPGSTGGGIKTCTFGVLVATAISMLKNRDRVFIFNRTVPKDVIRKALVVVFLAIGWIFMATLLLSIIEYQNLGYFDNYFLKILFEVTSAFGTVGLSTGVTPLLSPIGKFIIILTMFIGRVGPLTLALAVALQSGKISYKYPEEKIMIG